MLCVFLSGNEALLLFRCKQSFPEETGLVASQVMGVHMHNVHLSYLVHLWIHMPVGRHAIVLFTLVVYAVMCYAH